VSRVEYITSTINGDHSCLLSPSPPPAPVPLSLEELRMRRTEVGNVGIRSFTTLLLQDPSFLPHLRELDFRSTYTVDSHKLRMIKSRLKKIRGGLQLLFHEDSY